MAEATDAWLAAVAADAGLERIGGALVAVGSYGRQQLAPGSDLDLVLLLPSAPDMAEVSRVADRIWYPIWDSGIALDHSVRTLQETRKLASSDLKVVFGLLDCRPVVGDHALAEQVKSAILGDWRSQARTRLPEVYEAVQERIDRAHELAHLLEPDLKESYGGLRDVALLRAIAASWITDFPHDTVFEAAATLMDVRDALHLVTQRSTDRLTMQEQQSVAELVGVESDDALLRRVIDAGRAISYASDLTWHRVQRLTRKPPVFRRMRAQAGDARVPLADGVVVQFGEVFLARDAKPDREPVLLLRAAAAAAQAGLRFAPETVDRFANTDVRLPRPWPRAAREAFVSLLGAGASAIPVWEALDNVGLMTQLLPQWSAVRSLPQRNALHTYTVDRHQVETAAHAALFTRDVHRPDLLLVGALFHDIGKGRGPDHSGTGAMLMRDIAAQLGFDADDVETLCLLVQHHLLLAESATRRDIDDPATIQYVAEAVRSHEQLDLLHTLTKADSLATGPNIWNEWKARLIQDLVDRVHAALKGAEPIEQMRLSDEYPALVVGSEVDVEMHVTDDGVRVAVAAPDRLGLLANVAGVLSLHRLDVRSARVETVGTRALQSWLTTPMYGDAPSADAVAGDIRMALDGALDVESRIRARRAPVAKRRGFVPPPPRVTFIHGASDRADVMEVRAHDAPALLWSVGNVLADMGITVAAARVATLGSEVIDVLYLTKADGARLQGFERDDLARAVERTLSTAD